MGVGLDRTMKTARLAHLGMPLALLLMAASAQAADRWSPGLRLSAEERYDDDLLLRSDDLATGQLMTKLTPQMTLAGRSRTWELDASYAPDFFLRHGSGTQTIDHRLELAHNRRFSPRLSLQAEGRLWYVSDPTSLPRMGMARSLVPVLYGVSELGVSWGASRRWILRADYRFEGTRIEEVGREPGFLHQPQLQAIFRADRRTEIGAQVRLQSFLFEGQSAAAYGPSALLRHRLGPNLRLGLDVGASWFEEHQGDGARGWAPRFTASLDGDRRHFLWGVAAGHDLVGASGFTTALWADFASATMGWNLTRELQMRLMGNLFRNGPAPGVGAWQLRADTAVSQGYGVAGALEWQLQPEWALQLQLTRIGQVGSVGAAAPELTRNIAAVRAVFTPWR